MRFCAPHAEEGRASPWTSPGLSQVSSQVCIRSAAGLGRPRKAKEELKEAGGLGRKGMGKFLTIYHISMFGFFTWHLKYHKTAIICLKESYEKIFKMLYEEMV